MSGYFFVSDQTRAAFATTPECSFPSKLLYWISSGSVRLSWPNNSSLECGQLPRFAADAIEPEKIADLGRRREMINQLGRVRRARETGQWPGSLL